MPTRSLPERPSLAQLKLQAKELQRVHSERRQAAAARMIANHPRYAHASVQGVLDAPLRLADAQLIIAREYGFQSWAALKHVVETESRVAKYTSHPRFNQAVAAIDAGDLKTLEALVTSNPELVRARTNLAPPYGYFTGATLLHHVAWNPGRTAPVPANVADIARLLLEHGAEVDASTLGRNGGTTMGLVVTSKMASDANVSGPLIDLLVEYGARLGPVTSRSPAPGKLGRGALDASLTDHAPRAAEKLIELGAEPDVFAAAALGQMDLLRSFFTTDGRLTSRPTRPGVRFSERDAIGLALLYAYVNRRSEAVDFLLELDANLNMTGVNNGAMLHRAAWDGDLAMVKRLVAKGADMSNRDNPFNSTPLSWAQHNKQREVFDWMRANCRIDLHEAVANNLREHVEARLREDPASVNKRVDHWDAPQSTPLYWAAWTRIDDIDGVHYWDESDRESLVRLLLDSGADPNIVAGDGYAPLDVAMTAGASRIVALLEANGAKSATEL
jgi:ankyrin repeat protein